MKWAKFKKERISLNYTVMLLPHSEKKPIHFKTPVWTFGLFFLGLLVLTGTCLFFAGSRHQLEQVRKEKEQLEQEWQQLAAEKQLADEENETLRQVQEVQKQELKKLEQKARDTIKELEILVQREDQIRQELGLQQVADAGEEAAESGKQLLENTQESEEQESESVRQEQEERPAVQESEEQPASQEQEQAQVPAAQQQEQTPASQEQEETSDPQAQGADGEGSVQAMAQGPGEFQATAVDLQTAVVQDASSFQTIQSQLGDLQSSLSRKTSQYNGYLSTIEEKREAEAAEKARQEATRASIVNNAESFIGNRYVYGGNDPHTGVDCSGFTKYILGNTAGVSLNRTAASQSTQGHPVSAENARPGDLVFYSGGGSIDHVAIYIGNGQVVHASNENTGIIKSNMYYRTPAKIVNVLGD